MILLLNDNIRKYRKSKHMSQDELAEKLNVTRQSISLWETGQTQPSLDNIIALAKLFDISTDTLLTENDSASVETDEGSSKLNKSSKKKTVIIASACFVIAIALITVAVLFGNDSNNTVNNDTVIPNEEVDPSNDTQYDVNDKAQTIFEETTTGEDVVESPTSERKEEALSNKNDQEQTSSEETTTG